MENQDPNRSKREEAWSQIECLVLIYQSQIGSAESQRAAYELIERFTPLFNKYLKILRYNDLSLYDPETKRFVFSFIDKETRKKYPKNNRDIRYRFRFITKTYGMLSEEEILSDIYEIFFKMAKRYKQTNRNFCAYIYNAFHYEMSRTIKHYTGDISNIPYKSYIYVDSASTEDFTEEEEIESFSLDWINGDCAKAFKNLSPLDRKIIIYYYGDDDFPDKKISELLNIHINTVNQRRRKAIKSILEELQQKDLKIKRSRKIYNASPK